MAHINALSGTHRPVRPQESLRCPLRPSFIFSLTLSQPHSVPKLAARHSSKCILLPSLETVEGACSSVNTKVERHVSPPAVPSLQCLRIPGRVPRQDFQGGRRTQERLSKNSPGSNLLRQRLRWSHLQPAKRAMKAKATRFCTVEARARTTVTNSRLHSGRVRHPVEIHAHNQLATLQRSAE